MQLSKLLTEMTDSELKEHLAALRKVHSASATTTVRRQVGAREKTAKKKVDLADKLRALTPEKIAQLRAALGM